MKNNTYLENSVKSGSPDLNLTPMNKDHTPSATDLKSAWDDLWPFIENIWR